MFPLLRGTIFAWQNDLLVTSIGSGIGYSMQLNEDSIHTTENRGKPKDYLLIYAIKHLNLLLHSL